MESKYQFFVAGTKGLAPLNDLGKLPLPVLVGSVKSMGQQDNEQGNAEPVKVARDSRTRLQIQVGVMGELIGVLTGTGGITEVLPVLETSLAAKNTGAEVVYIGDPGQLVGELLDRYLSGSYVCPCYPENLKPGVSV